MVCILRKLQWMSFLIITALLLSACGQSPSATSGQVAIQGETVKIVHKQGETIVRKNPQRIVVFDLGMLDTMEKLNIEVLALPKGILPAYLSKYKDEKYVNVGSLMEPNFEKINSLKPDLIIIGDRQAKAYQEFSAIAPTINLQVDQTNFIASFKANMRQVGEVFNKKEAVESALRKIGEQIAAISGKNSEQALIIMTTGGKLHAFGPGSRFPLIHDVLGLKSVMTAPAGNEKKDIHGKIISFEYIAQSNPDYLFVIDRDDAIGQSAAARQLLNNDLVNSTKAARNGRIVYLNSGMWYLAGSGLLSVEKMLDEIKQVVR